MTDSTSMDFLGQKRRVRPVRKVQVSTHFDDLNLTAGGSSTPEPPGLDETIIKEVNTESEINAKEGVTVPETRSAVYASKFPSPPPELNTLVPEDFNMIDFNFNDLNQKKKDEVIKTDNSFIIPETEEPEIEKNEELNTEENKGTEAEESKETKENEAEDIEEKITQEAEPKSKPADTDLVAAAAVAATAAVATATVLSTVEEEKSPVEEAAPEAPAVVEEPLQKVSEARKSLEPSPPSPTEPEPVIIAEAPKLTDEAQIDVLEEVKEDNADVAEVEEITAPPPLPTDNAHLVAARESLKPSLLPVKPVNGAPTTDTDTPKPQASTSPLAQSAVTATELENMRKELEEQKAALEREIESKKALESQIQAMITKADAQEEALKYKNDTLDQLNTDYLKTKNDLTSARNEKEKLELALAKAEEELAKINETNVKAYLEKSDEVTELKDKLAEFAAIIGQKNKEIDSLQRQLEEVKRTNVNTALENVQQYERIEEELMKAVEEEILRMQDTIEEQREYNAKLQMEVEAEYTYWKRRLELKEEAEAEGNKANE